MKTLMNSITCILLILSANGLLLNNSGKLAQAPKPAAKAPATKPATSAPKPAAKAQATKPAAKAPESKPQETLKKENAAILANIDYILKGYNAVYGNPHSGEVDPGFGKVIFNASYQLGKVTGDRKYKILDGTDLAKIDSCDTFATETQIKDAKSYQTVLSEDVFVRGGLRPVSFQASAGYKQVDEETKSSKFQFQEEQANCEVYTVSITEINSPLLTDDFIEVLKILPPYSKEVAKKYHEYLFSPYGTHCVSRMIMGARYGYLKKFTSTATSKSVGGGAGGVSAIVKIETNRKSTSSNENQDSSEKSFSIGSMPGDNVKDWLSQITTEMPIQYFLTPMDECLEFPKVEAQLKSKGLKAATLEKNINAALDNYCEDYLLPNKQVSSCPVKGGTTYLIKNEQTGMCIEHGEMDKPLTMMDCDSTKKSQIWQFNYYNPTGGYRLSSVDIRNASMEVEQGRTLFLRFTGGLPDQDISFDLDPNTGLYTFKLRFSIECFAVEDARVIQKLPTGKLVQKWRIIPAKP